MGAIDTENISEELVVFHCSPTMAGLKTGSLFNCPAKNDRAFIKRIREMNRHLLPRGVRIVPLKNMGKSVLVYMYRPARLREDLSNSAARQILEERDYPVGETEKCIVELVRRLEDGEAFPHEIGLFLGYPLEDVDGFIKNGAAGAKYIGVWKVYGNVENEKNTVKAGKKSYIERGVEKMNRHEEIKNAYKSLGGDATFYDGMITCSTLSGKAVCKLVWNIRTRRPAGKMMSQRPGTIHR